MVHEIRAFRVTNLAAGESVDVEVGTPSESADPGVKSFVILATMGDALVEGGGFEATVASEIPITAFFGFLTSMGVHVGSRDSFPSYVRHCTWSLQPPE